MLRLMSILCVPNNQLTDKLVEDSQDSDRCGMKLRVRIERRFPYLSDLKMMYDSFLPIRPASTISLYKIFFHSTNE